MALIEMASKPRFFRMTDVENENDQEALWLAASVVGISANTLPPAGFERPLTERAYTGDLTDAEFDAIRPYLPPEPRQAHFTTNRHVVDALIWVLRSQRKRSQLPACYGSLDSVRKRSERWGVSGVWDRLLEQLPLLGLTDMRKKELMIIAITEGRRGQRIRYFRENPHATSQPRGTP